MKKRDKKIYKTKRNSIHCDLSLFCYLTKDSDFIEVTEWTNGEGYDIDFNDRHISLTHGELRAINALTALI